MSVDVAMLDLFRTEVETQAQVLTSGLLALERDGRAPGQLDLCMRAAHSLKGAARIVGLDVGVRLAHAMEDCFVAAQQGLVALGRDRIDRLLAALDLLVRVATTPGGDLDHWVEARTGEVDECLSSLAGAPGAPGEAAADLGMTSSAAVAQPAAPAPAAAAAPATHDAQERVLRVTAESLNRLLGLAAESLVESRWVKPFGDSLLRLKRIHADCGAALDQLRDRTGARGLDERSHAALATAQRLTLECQRLLAQRLAEIETFDRRSLNLAHRLYDEALACRMRPFGDALQGFPRMVRDVAQELGKQVRLELTGETTTVDRDVLASLDAPLGHLLRNAVDHGIEPPDARIAAGKPPEGIVRLEARHSAGALQVIVSDDGCGIDFARMRGAVVARGLLNADAANGLSEAELADFLFLPGFTLKDTITEVSGRGVGLDAVRDMVRQVRGTVSVSSRPGAGTRFTLQLPVTLSVVRALLAGVGGEPYAFPLSSIVTTLKLERDRIETLEGREHFRLDGRHVSLVSAHHVLAAEHSPATTTALCVIVLGSGSQTYGLVVDDFIGEQELVVRPLDPQLGKVKDVAAGALMDDGAPVLIVDPDDLLRSMDKIYSPTRLHAAPPSDDTAAPKRVLVIDDSITVREVERKLLGNRGYEVEVAVDGMDGWNAVRASRFDLVVTDIDMPRMDGIELVTLINADPALKSIPVVVVSYKDREDDRRRGLDAGAAYYLTKGSFQDDSFVRAVVDLIGEAQA